MAKSPKGIVPPGQRLLQDPHRVECKGLVASLAEIQANFHRAAFPDLQSPTMLVIPRFDTVPADIADDGRRRHFTATSRPSGPAPTGSAPCPSGRPLRGV